MNINANEYIREVIPKYSKRKSRKQVIIHQPEDIYKLFLDISDNALEKFIGIFLDNKSKVNCFQIFGTGTIGESKVYISEIIRTALITGSNRVILLHNHPSGTLDASVQDKLLTDKIDEALKMFHIDLIDHLVISEEGFYSFEEHNLI